MAWITKHSEGECTEVPGMDIPNECMCCGQLTDVYWGCSHFDTAIALCRGCAGEVALGLLLDLLHKGLVTPGGVADTLFSKMHHWNEWQLAHKMVKGPYPFPSRYLKLKE